MCIGCACHLKTHHFILPLPSCVTIFSTVRVSRHDVIMFVLLCSLLHLGTDVITTLRLLPDGIIGVRVGDSCPFVLGDGPRAQVREQAEEDNAATDDCDGGDDERDVERQYAVGRHQSNRVQDVDERRENVTMEVTA